MFLYIHSSVVMYGSELFTAMDALLALLLNYLDRAKLVQQQASKINTRRVGLRLNIAEPKAKKIDILDFLTILVYLGKFNYHTMYLNSQTLSLNE